MPNFSLSASLQPSVWHRGGLQIDKGLDGLVGLSEEAAFSKGVDGLEQDDDEDIDKGLDALDSWGEDPLEAVDKGLGGKEGDDGFI